MILPEVAFAGTFIVIWFKLLVTKEEAETLLIFTELTPRKFVPVMVIFEPLNPTEGEKPLIVGGAGTKQETVASQPAPEPNPSEIN